MKRLSVNARRIVALAVSASLALVVAPVLTAGSATAATQVVTITGSGFVPIETAIKVGDTVSFTNSDTAAHQVQFRQSSGFTCTVKPLVIQPTQTQSCTFTTAGNYTFDDPNEKGSAYKGAVVVTAVVVPTLSLAASTPTVVYGNQTTLSGKLTPGTAGALVDVLALETGESTYVKVATVTTTGNGAFTSDVATQIRTTYRVESTSGTQKVVSPTVTIQVRPRVRLSLRSIAKGYAYFTTKVISTLSYPGVRVVAQRRNSYGGWTAIKAITLSDFSGARFKVRLPKGTSQIRVLLPVAVAGNGYLAGFSRGISVTR